ncbi:hypothetical protein PR048_020925, partial [Dryococelus australis]
MTYLRGANNIMKFLKTWSHSKLKLNMQRRVQKNSTYMSLQSHSEIIGLCGDVIRDDTATDVKYACAYSILADESSDISGKEQFSIGVKFFDEEKMMVREEFLDFVELTAMDAKSIASAIDNFVENAGLGPEKCVGQGYNGCSTTAGKDGGVHKIVRERCIFTLLEHYVQIVMALETLSKDCDIATRKTVFQMHCASTNSEFIVCVCLIAKCSMFGTSAT